MQVSNIKGIHLLSDLNVEGNSIRALYKEEEVFSIPFKKVANTALYNNVDIAIDVPFDEYLETDDILCEMRFYIPPVTDAEEGKDYTLINQIHETIKKKANIEENVNDLIVS